MKESYFDMLEAWPTVIRAIAWTELIICGSPGGGEETTWEMMVRCGLDIQEIHKLLVRAADCTGENSGVPPDVLEAVRRQVRHPDYRKYLAGKMGLI